MLWFSLLISEHLSMNWHIAIYFSPGTHTEYNDMLEKHNSFSFVLSSENIEFNHTFL